MVGSSLIHILILRTLMPSFPVCDRKVYFDSQSRDYPIRRMLGPSKPLSKRVWQPIRSPLDQGREGRCVIFGWGGELAASPHRYNITDQWCNQHWPLVQAKDREMGNDWSD